VARECFFGQERDSDRRGTRTEEGLGQERDSKYKFCFDKNLPTICSDQKINVHWEPERNQDFAKERA